jgi:putative dimethyl sulfoxide reductase chaperone
MIQKNLENWKTALMGETLLFGLLGKVLYKEPDKKWLETLIRNGVFKDVPFGTEQNEVIQGLEILHKWTEENRNKISDKEFSAINKDHLYLFVGVGKPLAPVWESIYFSESRLLFQEQTFQVREWFARYGLQIEQKYKEPDDHIGLELGFIAHLAALALTSLEAGDNSEVENNLQAQRDFLAQHLQLWGGEWADLVIKHTGTNFYRGLAYLTKGALKAVSELLEK